MTSQPIQTPQAPAQGDIVWLDFTPQSGHEQAGRRPALVLSKQVYNRVTGRAFVCPITSKPKGYPFEVPVRTAHISGVVLSDQLKNLDWRARNCSPTGDSLKRHELEPVWALVQSTVDLN